MMFALAMGIVTANAQENVTVEQSNGSEQPTNEARAETSSLGYASQGGGRRSQPTLTKKV